MLIRIQDSSVKCLQYFHEFNKINDGTGSLLYPCDSLSKHKSEDYSVGNKNISSGVECADSAEQPYSSVLAKSNELAIKIKMF